MENGIGYDDVFDGQQYLNGRILMMNCFFLYLGKWKFITAQRPCREISWLVQFDVNHFDEIRAAPGKIGADNTASLQSNRALAEETEKYVDIPMSIDQWLFTFTFIILVLTYRKCSKSVLISRPSIHPAMHGICLIPLRCIAGGVQHDPLGTIRRRYIWIFDITRQIEACQGLFPQ